MNISNILLFIQQAASLAPCIVLCYLPFQNSLTRKRRKIVIESAFACFIVSTANLIFNATDIDSSGNIGVAMLLLPGFFYYRKTVNAGLSKMLFVFFVAVHAGSIGGGIEISVYMFTGIHPDEPRSRPLTLLFILSWLLIYAIIGFVIHRFFTPRLRQIKSEDMRGMWLIPLLFASITVCLHVYFYAVGVAYIPLAILPILGIMSFLVYVILLRILSSMEKKAQFELEAVQAHIREQSLTADNAALDRLNRMKADLIATVTHETMTPLAVLSVYSELIAKELRQKGVDEQTAKDLDVISEETQRIKWLMDELQNHAREKENSLLKTRLNLTELMHNTARMYTPILERKNIKLAVDFPEDLPDIYGCANEVTQVFFNLLQNSRNHAEDGEVNITAETQGEFVSVTVSDTGSGIPSELLPRVFERGVSGGEGGTGLGLSICKEIIQTHGGKISIESEAGKGTSVRFTLPVWKGTL